MTAPLPLTATPGGTLPARIVVTGLPPGVTAEFGIKTQRHRVLLTRDLDAQPDGTYEALLTGPEVLAAVGATWDLRVASGALESATWGSGNVLVTRVAADAEPATDAPQLVTLAVSEAAQAVVGIVVTQGPAGLSAFEVAVAAGFAGTAAEWLASLAGTDGDPGPAPTLAPPTVATLAAGAPATAALVESAPDVYRLDLGIPTGDPGESVTITATTSQATYDAATPGPLEIVVLYEV